jgi:hypothetical protein
MRLSFKRQSHLRSAHKGLQARLDDYRLGREEILLHPLKGDRGFYPRGLGNPSSGTPASKRPEDVEARLKFDLSIQNRAVFGLPKFNARITPRAFLKGSTKGNKPLPPLKGRDDCKYPIYPLRDFLDYTSRIKSMEYSAYGLLEHVLSKPWSKTRASVTAIKTLSYRYDAIRGYLVSRSAGGPSNLRKLAVPVFRFLHLPLHGSV